MELKILTDENNQYRRNISCVYERVVQCIFQKMKHKFFISYG